MKVTAIDLLLSVRLGRSFTHRLFFILAPSCALFILLDVGWANQSVYLQMVVVGDAGNPADITGFGAVPDAMRIDKYDVTQGQYAAFLNAVAATDTYALYDTRMATDQNVAGISRAGASGAYTYAAIGSGNKPASYLNWFSAARFANWLHNGQPTGAQAAGTTEQGAYPLNGAISGVILKNAAAQYWIPSEDEWYKAAFYDQSLSSGAGGYWQYPTRSNTAPGNIVGPAANQANIYTNGTGFSVTQSKTYSNVQNYLTDVGTYSGSASYYGTFDQGGDVLEWNDGVISPGRGLRGGSWPGSATFLLSSYRPGVDPSTVREDYGFRIATIAASAIGSSEAAGPLIAVTGLNVNLTVKASIPGRTYQLQVCDDLATANWQDSGSPQVGTAKDLVITVPIDPSVPRQFYRLKLS